ncbi:MAG: hemerythrin domain-containing protein [Capsulimonadaceae bacterium]|nr:hemerythrin domain-containing protein [Capsulimonadaceae bacterium]
MEAQLYSNNFADPLKVLRDCHQRIMKFLAVLIRISRDYRGGSFGKLDRADMEASLRYFHSAIALHSADEEVSIFSRLLMDAADPASNVHAEVRTLEGEHRTLSKAHDEIERFGRIWLDTGSLPPADWNALNKLLDAVNTTYWRHIATEETVIYPLAAKLMTPEDMVTAGREMAHRRGIDLNAFDGLPRTSQRKIHGALLLAKRSPDAGKKPGETA